MTHVGPDDAPMMQDNNHQNCPIHELPVSLYKLMFHPLGSFVTSQFGKEPDQN